jgi:hypothetical protein
MFSLSSRRVMAWQLAIDQAWISKGSVCVDLKKKKKDNAVLLQAFREGKKS